MEDSFIPFSGRSQVSFSNVWLPFDHVPSAPLAKLAGRFGRKQFIGKFMPLLEVFVTQHLTSDALHSLPSFQSWTEGKPSETFSLPTKLISDLYGVGLWQLMRDVPTKE